VSAAETMDARTSRAVLPAPVLLPDRPIGLAAHMRLYGRALPSRPDLISLLASAGLTGRGGAGFPVHRKLAAVADAARTSGRAPVVVANGCEGEPASWKDRELLRRAPHLVLDGLCLAARALSADAAYLALDEGSGLAAALVDAVAERGDEARGAGIRVVGVSGRFIAGESSALISALEGGAGLPRYRPEPGRTRGFGGAPVLVQNVETLAQIALIARYGAEWFRSVGTVGEPGPMLSTVHTAELSPRVLQTQAGTPLWSLLGPLRRPVRAVLIGGYHGSWIPAETAYRSRYTAAELGVPLGAGLIAALPIERCGLAETARVLRYLALQSAGQCGPCLNGLPRIAAAFTRLADPAEAARPDARNLIADLDRWCELVEGRGACHHPDGSVRLVRSALDVFIDEVHEHRRGVCHGTDARPLLPTPPLTS
jgi:NADH:ubiquinone oxidoreductase subunit F (NADH-binding)